MFCIDESSQLLGEACELSSVQEQMSLLEAKRRQAKEVVIKSPQQGPETDSNRVHRGPQGQGPEIGRTK